MENSAGRKRGRSLNTQEDQPKTPCETTPPNKRNTRSQSRKRSVSSLPTARDLSRAIDLALSEEEEEERQIMSQNTQDLEAGNVKNLSDMAKFFEERLSSLPTKDYMDKRLSKIEEKAEDTAQGLKTLERRVRIMEEVQDKNIGRPNSQARTTAMAARNDTRAPNAINEAREEAFLKAIRSIRIWPIEGTDGLETKVDAFLKSALCMRTKELESVIIEDIYTVRSSPRSRQHNEVCVLLRDSDTRELFLSYARNLATYVDAEGNPTAGIRM